MLIFFFVFRIFCYNICMIKKFNKLLTNNIIFIVVIFLATISLYNSISPLKRAIVENKEAKEDLNKANDELDNKTEELNLLNNEDTKEEVARETYKISEDDEILFVFPE